MQFTGLYDKNGKEIYEGDVIAIYYTNQNLDTDEIFKKKEVKWGTYNIGCNGKEYDFTIIGPYVEDEYLYDKMAKNEVTVLGNIYENPELLKPNK